MGISKKRKRKIIVNDRLFYWCIKKADEDNDRLYLVITSDDKKFLVSYMLGQRDEKNFFAPRNPYILVKSCEFKGLDGLGKTWERFLVPEWDDEIITPSLVAEIIHWSLAEGEAIPVNYNGDILSMRPLKLRKILKERNI